MKLPRFSGRPRSLNPFLLRRVTGHSMMPVLPPKTLVIGWRFFGRLRPSQVVIIQHNGLEKVKRIEKVLGDGSLFVVGDYAESSTDSRQFGAVDPRQVVAKVIWPSTKSEVNPY